MSQTTLRAKHCFKCRELKDVIFGAPLPGGLQPYFCATCGTQLGIERTGATKDEPDHPDA